MRALTKRAAAAEISPDTTESRSASVIIGTSWLATRSNPRSVSENDTMATAAAITVMRATAPKASLQLASDAEADGFCGLAGRNGWVSLSNRLCVGA